jgi:hypothetical protein
LLDYQSRDPETLMGPKCTLSMALATAQASGTLSEEDSEGSCLVTQSASYEAGVSGLLPACAGTFDFRIDSEEPRVVVCDEERFPSAMNLNCEAVSRAATYRVISGPHEIDGDVIGTLDLSVARPSTPVIRTPVTQGEGTALWPSGTLTVEWNAALGGGVEIVIRSTTHGGPRLTCLVGDDGSFSPPNRLLEAFRSSPVYVEVARIHQEVQNADGFEVRMSYRTSGTIWLFQSAN